MSDIRPFPRGRLVTLGAVAIGVAHCAAAQVAESPIPPGMERRGLGTYEQAPGAVAPAAGTAPAPGTAAPMPGMALPAPAPGGALSAPVPGAAVPGPGMPGTAFPATAGGAASAPATGPATATAPILQPAPPPVPVVAPPPPVIAPPPPPAPAPPPPPPVFSSPTAAPPDPTRSDAPSGWPKLVVTGGVHSPNPAHRMVIINGAPVREGSEPVPGLVVEQVRAASVVLSFRGQRHTVTY
jgi:general secretion pathway protein B